VRQRRYARHFAAATQRGLHLGVFGSFAEAVAAVPAGRPIGADHPHAADLIIPGGAHLLEEVNPRDYALLFWLSRFLREGATSVFDFGGHVGVKYYGFRRYLAYPDAFRWTVYDMPTVTRAGEALAAERPDTRGLAFTNRLEDADGMDVFFAAGSLQYEETPLDRLLGRLTQPPPRLLLSGLPLTEGPGFVTLQTNGPGCAPYAIRNRGQFIREVEGAGYTLEDAWAILEKKCVIPFHEDRLVRSYSGLYFRRMPSRGASG
jgi:putative methyltransferase (TIGR04325 family)